MDTQPLRVHIILGSTRPGRVSEKVAPWLLETMKGVKGMTPELIDLRDHPLPFYDEKSSLGMLGDDVAHPEAKAWAAKVGEADAYIVIAPEYNHGYPAVLKNALDYAYKQWNNKPIGFVSYGSAGGARSVEQLRLVAVELQMAPIRTAVHIPAPWSMMENGEFKPGVLEQYKEVATNMLTQLHWWGQALRAARANA